MGNDRTVHAVLVDGSEVVRYDRAGKWRREGGRFASPLSVAGAVNLAVTEGVEVFLYLRGGKQFDSKYRNAIRGGNDE